MKTESTSYSSFSTLETLNPRYVIALSFDDADTDITYLTSHSDALDPGGVAAIDRIDGCIDSISGQTQKVSPDTAQHTIGNITFKLLDVNSEISTKIKAKLDGGEGLRRKRIVLYKGFSGLTAWADYTKRFTYKVDSISYKDGIYTLSCSDIQREAKDKIFEIDQGVLTSDITASATLPQTIPITIASASGKFKTVVHDAIYSANPSATVGYIKIDDEVICHSGWTDGTFTALQVVERGALNTTAAAHTNQAGTTSTDQNKKVEEYIYLEMPAAKMIYALLTGVLHGDSATLPGHWHLGIDTNYVALSDFTGIGSDLWDTASNTGRMARFVGVTSDTGKSFIEKELLLWLGAFMPVYSDGSLGLKRLNNVLPYSGYVAYLDESQVTGYSDLNYDQKSVINNISIRWNWIDSLDRYTKTTQLIDSGSISKYGKANKKDFYFKGVFSGRHTDTDIRNYFNRLADRYSAPPLRLSVDVLPQWDKLDVGDTVRLDLSQVQDYNAGTTLTRVFEIQQVRTDWLTGRVSLDLFGGTQPGALEPLSSSFVMDNAFYSSAGTDLSTVLTISAGAVTASGTLNNAGASRAIYYYLGDLTINSGVTVTIKQNVELRVMGTLVINGTINGVGQGAAGGSGGISPSGSYLRANLDTAFSGKKPSYGTIGGLGFTIPSGSVSRFDNTFSTPTASFGLYNSTSLARDKAPQFAGRQQLDFVSITNPDGLTIQGINTISNLTGSGGGGGESSFAAVEGGGSIITFTALANGGAGGNGGAGLALISRGVAFGASGGIDVSGGSGGASASGTASGDVFNSSPGCGGWPGGVYIFIDGNSSAPDTSKIITNIGSSPIPSAAAYITRSTQRSFGMPYLFTGAGSYAVNFLGSLDHDYPNNSSRDYVRVQYIPPALNGYTWLPADEIKEVTGYESKPPTWDQVVDTGTKPADNANLVTATSQITDDAGLGQTAVWTNVVGTGKPADNASGSAVTVQDEGVSLTADVTKLNFVGAGVTVTSPVADEILVTISTAPVIADGEFCPGYAFARVDNDSIITSLDIDITKLFNAGRRVKIADGTDKYGVVSLSSYTPAAGTTLDFTMEDAAIIAGNPTEVCLTSSTTAWVPIATDPFGGSSINAIVSGSVGATVYWVAVGDGGQIFYSTDKGVTWTAGTGYTTTVKLNDIAYDSDNERFMAVGNDGVFLTSSNGTTWTQDTTSIHALDGSFTGSGHCTSVCYLNIEANWGIVWARHNTTSPYSLIYSTNFGSTWTTSDTQTSYPYITTGVFGSLQRVYTTGGGEDINYYPTLTTTAPTVIINTSSEPTTNCVSVVTHPSNTGYVAYGKIGGNLHSRDSISVGSLDDITLTADVNNIAHSDALGRFVAVANSGQMAYIDEADVNALDSWTAITNGFSPLTNILDIEYNETDLTWVAVAANGQICRSTSGIS